MLNEGLVHNTSATLVKSEMIRALHRLGPTTPELWERETFKGITGHDHDELDWSIEDNQAGYYTWLRSFDQLIGELIEDGFVREENAGTDQHQLVPVATDPAVEWSQFVYPSRPE
jgi:hypothetical protein